MYWVRMCCVSVSVSVSVCLDIVVLVIHAMTQLRCAVPSALTVNIEKLSNSIPHSLNCYQGYNKCISGSITNDMFTAYDKKWLGPNQLN